MLYEVITPLIEESEALNAKSAVELYQEVSRSFGSYNVGLLHGRMKNSEKEEIMRKFKKGGIDILVSTTVIEVGVNIPNASIMLVSDAHRFGLSSLHQLRGRVGRGEHASYCFLISETENDISRITSYNVCYTKLLRLYPSFFLLFFIKFLKSSMAKTPRITSYNVCYTKLLRRDPHSTVAGQAVRGVSRTELWYSP